MRLRASLTACIQTLTHAGWGQPACEGAGGGGRGRVGGAGGSRRRAGPAGAGRRRASRLDRQHAVHAAHQRGPLMPGRSRGCPVLGRPAPTRRPAGPTNTLYTPRTSADHCCQGAAVDAPCWGAPRRRAPRSGRRDLTAHWTRCVPAQATGAGVQAWAPSASLECGWAGSTLCTPRARQATVADQLCCAGSCLCASWLHATCQGSVIVMPWRLAFLQFQMCCQHRPRF